MFYKFRPLKEKDVERALKKLGFTEEKRKGTSHRQWSKIVAGHLRKVTFCAHKGEVSAKVIQSLIKQAGVKKEQFYDSI